MSTNPQDGSRPTVVLVHGAFAESASWNGVIRRLQESIRVRRGGCGPPLRAFFGE
jgi:hypothetical protein